MNYPISLMDTKPLARQITTLVLCYLKVLGVYKLHVVNIACHIESRVTILQSLDPVSSVEGNEADLIKLGCKIGHFRITFGLFFKASLGAHLFIWKLVFICMWMKANFHMKRWALGLSLKKRTKVFRKAPIERSSSPRMSRGSALYVTKTRGDDILINWDSHEDKIVTKTCDQPQPWSFFPCSLWGGEMKDAGSKVVTLWGPFVPLSTLFTKWPCILLTELNFHPPATGKSKKRKKRIALLLTQKEKLWLLMEELQYVVSRICRIKNSYHHELVAHTCYLN